jgi:hypothetical protein
VFPAPPNVSSQAKPTFWGSTLPGIRGATVMVLDVPREFYNSWAGWAQSTISCLPRRVRPLSTHCGSVSAAAELLEFSPLLGFSAHHSTDLIGLWACVGAAFHQVFWQPTKERGSAQRAPSGEAVPDGFTKLDPRMLQWGKGPFEQGALELLLAASSATCQVRVLPGPDLAMATEAAPHRLPPLFVHAYGKAKRRAHPLDGIRALPTAAQAIWGAGGASPMWKHAGVWQPIPGFRLDVQGMAPHCAREVPGLRWSREDPPRTRQELSLYSHLLEPEPPEPSPDWHASFLDAPRGSAYAYPTATDLWWVPVSQPLSSTVMEAVEAADHLKFSWLLHGSAFCGTSGTGALAQPG